MGKAMEGKIVYFSKPGPENTDEVLQIAKLRAEELGIKNILVATTTGNTGVRATEVFGGMRVVVVSHHAGMRAPNTQELTEQNRQKIENKEGTILTTMHAFAGVDRELRLKFDTLALGEIIANVLRVFGNGMKVACEITLMAADSGLVRTDEDVIAIGGTGRGADTALVLRPVNSINFFDLQVREILCKPHL